MSKTYQELLSQPEWREVRHQIIQRDSFQCRSCGQSTSLHVHHRLYLYDAATRQPLPPWKYPLHLLITLCQTCHKNGHQTHTIPHLSIHLP